MVHISRFNQILGVYTLQAANEATKVCGMSEHNFCSLHITLDLSSLFCINRVNLPFISAGCMRASVFTACAEPVNEQLVLSPGKKFRCIAPIYFASNIHG